MAEPTRTLFQLSISGELIKDMLAYGVAGCVPLDPVTDVRIVDVRMAQELRPGAHPEEVTLLLYVPREGGGTSWLDAPPLLPRYERGQPLPRPLHGAVLHA